MRYRNTAVKVAMYCLLPILTDLCFIGLLQHFAGRGAIAGPVVCAVLFYAGLAVMILLPLIRAWTGESYFAVYACYGAWSLPMVIAAWIVLGFGHPLTLILLACCVLQAAGWVLLVIKKLGTQDPYDCPCCHGPISPHDERCPRCNAINVNYLKFPEPPKPRPWRAVLRIALIALIVVILGVLAIVTVSRLR